MEGRIKGRDKKRGEGERPADKPDVMKLEKVHFIFSSLQENSFVN